jgi:anion-transporting  ArsA/GET3 family ATPase
MARVGPVAKGAREIAEMVADPDFTGFVAVTTADEMAVTETLLLRDALELEGLCLSSVAVNCLYPNRFTPDEIAGLERCDVTPTEPIHNALRAALLDHHRARREAAQVERLADGVAAPLIALPFLFVDEVDRGALDALAEAFTDAERGSWPRASLSSGD